MLNWFRRKYHFFHLAYADKHGKPVVITITTSHPYVNDRNVQYGRQQLELEVNAPMIAVSYMGRMTLKQWNSPS